MAYAKTTWVDGAAPALDAAHLNNIEDGIEAIDVRLTTAEGNITTANTNISTNSTDITTNTNDISTINTTLNDAVVILTGTFSGNQSPTLLTTFGVTSYADYNWTVDVVQTSRTTTNGHLVIVDGYVDVDGNTVQLKSTDDGAAIAARYTIVGYKKSVSSIATLNL